VENIREREGFISVVSRIGGLLAFFKISALLYVFHNYLYERTTFDKISKDQQRALEVAANSPRLNQSTELSALIETDKS
jgi:hypothetical protein